MIAFLDKYAVYNWRLLHRFWSVRLTIFWAVVAALWIALPAFQGFLDPFFFAILCIVFSLAIAFARLTHQPGID